MTAAGVPATDDSGRACGRSFRSGSGRYYDCGRAAGHPGRHSAFPDPVPKPPAPPRPGAADPTEPPATAEQLRDLIRENRRLRAVEQRVRHLAETWTRYPQSPEDRERNRYGAAMEDCGKALREIVGGAS